MLNRIINGYTVIAQEYVPGAGYLILGMRRNHAGEFTYVTARMNNVDLDNQWFWGNYGGTDFKDNITAAVADFNKRKELV